MFNRISTDQPLQGNLGSPSGQSQSKCQVLGLTAKKTDRIALSIPRDLGLMINTKKDLLILTILSTLTSVILIHGFLSLDLLSLNNQAKLGSIINNIIVDDSATVVASDGSVVTPDAIAADDSASNSDGNPAGHIATDDGSDSSVDLVGSSDGQEMADDSENTERLRRNSWNSYQKMDGLGRTGIGHRN